MEEYNVQQNTSQQINLYDVVKLENQLKGGANWFYWIAGLSLVNSLVILFGGSLNFIVGLGITQVVDGIIAGIVLEVPSSMSTIVQVVGFVIVVTIAGVFVLFGFLGRKRYQWALIVGMVLYTLDGLIFLFVGDILSLGFHAFALFGVWGGLRALKKLNAVESGQMIVSDQPLPVQKQVRDRGYWMRLMRVASVFFIPFLILLIFLIVFILSY
jgi:hypothetical protein